MNVLRPERNLPGVTLLEVMLLDGRPGYALGWQSCSVELSHPSVALGAAGRGDID